MEIKREILLNNLAKRIKERRNELRLTQEDLSNKCNFDRTYISLLERGKRNPSYINLEILCLGLEIEISKLLEKTNEQEY